MFRSASWYVHLSSASTWKTSIVVISKAGANGQQGAWSTCACDQWMTSAHGGVHVHACDAAECQIKERQRKDVQWDDFQRNWKHEVRSLGIIPSKSGGNIPILWNSILLHQSYHPKGTSHRIFPFYFIIYVEKMDQWLQQKELWNCGLLHLVSAPRAYHVFAF
jgi:hypothetical protein